MASLRACPTTTTTPLLPKSFFAYRAPAQLNNARHNPWLKSAVDWKRRRRSLVYTCTTANGEVGRTVVEGEGEGEGEELGQDGYLARGFGWGVRRMVVVGEEMRMVAAVQAEAFHEPVALFNDFFLDFFKAEVLSALIYRLRNSAPDRYACLVAESVDGSSSLIAPELVGVVDVTVQGDGDVLRHLKGTKEYLYVSGIAVLIKYRRRKIATVLLEGCDVVSRRWGLKHLALRAYEEDSAARKLYAKAGYAVVASDPHWVTWFGKKRRVLMIKTFPSPSSTCCGS
ncbi:Uncharacterized protein M6B38_212295 [Iris pallida]|uniref:N-acetyltransferase domain-containing protein n=1 Tax=Iris pallida TaxID=29817 RepID=A0AAX6E395_IRIPA|nr:Uncharacterized protein M6B38_212295 [Iris pallida]